MEVVTGNVQLYEEHQPTVDALAQESLRLREELIAFAKAYAQMKVKDHEGELLKIFARDIHAAHQEFQTRLSCLANRALENKNNEAEQLSNTLGETCSQLAIVRKELVDAKRKLSILEREKSKNDNFRAELKRLLITVEQKSVWPTSGVGVLPTIRQFCEWWNSEKDEAGEGVDGDCARIDRNLKEMEHKIETIEGHRKEIYKRLEGIQKDANEWRNSMWGNRHQNISDKRGQAEERMNWINEGRNELKTLMGKISEDLENIKTKTEKLDNLVASDSEISKLIDFLKKELL